MSRSQEQATAAAQEPAGRAEPLSGESAGGEESVVFRVPQGSGEMTVQAGAGSPVRRYQVSGGLVRVPAAEAAAFVAVFTQAEPNSRAAAEATGGR